MRRKVKKRTPGGKIVIRSKRRRPSIARCAICKKPLHGIPRLIPSKFKDLPKTKKRPERPFGGYLCSKCMREVLKEKLMKR